MNPRMLKLILLLLVGLAFDVRAFAGEWRFEIIDHVGNVGTSVSVAIDPVSGEPCASYFDRTTREIKLARRGQSGWNSEVIDQMNPIASIVEPYTSLVFTSTGSPYIGYAGDYNNQVRCAHHGGTKWDIETVHDAGWNFVSSTSLAMSSSGHPCMAYWAQTSVSYAVSDGTEMAPHWSWQPIGATMNTLGGASLALDPSTDRPRIAYVRQGYDGTGVNFAAYDGQSWQTTFVEGSLGMLNELCLKLDPLTGNPRISGYRGDSGDLVYASFDGSNWSVQTIDSVGSVGTWNSLDINPVNGEALFSYYDATNGDLKFASYDAFGPHVQTVDSVGDVGQWSSLALDRSTGQPMIAYYDATNGDLKLAIRVPEPPGFILLAFLPVFLLLAIHHRFVRRSRPVV